jgi:hypothetical protein
MHQFFPVHLQFSGLLIILQIITETPDMGNRFIKVKIMRLAQIPFVNVMPTSHR